MGADEAADTDTDEGECARADFDPGPAPLRRLSALQYANTLRDLFPEAGDASKASFWCGLRPMTPDGTPVLGKAPKYDNLYLNTGHGTLGWTMAAGSARVIADMISGKAADIDTADLGYSRYQ